MRKVLGEWMRQFTCPKCGAVGAGSPEYLPLCHVCYYKVKMRPSNNGEILSGWKQIHVQERAVIESERKATD